MHEALALINCLDKFQSEILVDSDKKTETAKKAFEKLISKSSKNIMNEQINLEFNSELYDEPLFEEELSSPPKFLSKLILPTSVNVLFSSFKLFFLCINSFISTFIRL